MLNDEVRNVGFSFIRSILFPSAFLDARCESPYCGGVINYVREALPQAITNYVGVALPQAIKNFIMHKRDWKVNDIFCNVT